MEEEVAQAFRARPHLVDGAAGFIRMDVLTPENDGSEFWLVTYWDSEESFRTWHRSHLYRESHEGIPKGLKLDPAATELRGFRYVSS
jgi:heme-degrading monooxygenase HmoA